MEVGLEALQREGGAKPQSSAPPSSLSLYVAVVSILGLATMASVTVFTQWTATLSGTMLWPVIFLAAAGIVGEIRPVGFATGSSDVRYLSTSAPFVIALIAVSGVGVALLVQVLASLADDVLRRRDAKKSLFNISQYAISVMAGGAFYQAVIGEPVFAVADPVAFPNVGALLGAGFVTVGTNGFRVAAVVAIASQMPLRTVLRADAWHSWVSQFILICVGGIAAVIATDGVWPLLLLAGPVVAAHLFAASAARHSHQSRHDALTGLGNRGQMELRLSQAFQGSRDNGEGPGLVLLDLDHFKDVNDTLGHTVGDLILKEVASRLVAAAPDEATVHRLGGDEYAVVVTGDVDAVHQVAAGLLGSLDLPINVESLELLVRASAGVAVAPAHGTDGETLMKNADIALYHAKRERDRISTYSPELDINTVERLRLLTDLRNALEVGQLHVVYQPQIDLTNGRTVAVEALVRWDHPTRGTVAPDEFIRLAENSGLIFPVTDFVLNCALHELAQWRAHGHDIRMSVNLSARHLSDLALMEQISDALERHDVPSHALVLEVTETGILADSQRADAVIRSVRKLGVEIAIDDYGTGNASLSYLKRLEVDELKIDKSFVSSLNERDQDFIIVRSTIELALALGLRVVAEGIEDAQTEETLASLGHILGQGFHLGMPGSAQEVSERLRQEAGLTSTSGSGED